MNNAPHRSLIVTLIGDDRPGLVGELSAIVSAHGGNWLESSMSQLAGKFAGILRVDAPEARADELKAALESLRDLEVIARPAVATPPPRERRLSLSLVGHDRIGIVKEVAAVLVRHGINVESLDTRAESAPMSATQLFHARAALTAPATLNARALKADLEAISNDLMVDIALGEVM